MRLSNERFQIQDHITDFVRKKREGLPKQPLYILYTKRTGEESGVPFELVNGVCVYRGHM